MLIYRYSPFPAPVRRGHSKAKSNTMKDTDNTQTKAPSIWEVGTTDPDGNVVRLEIWGDRRMAFAYAEGFAEQSGQTCYVARLDLCPRSLMYAQKNVEPVFPPKEGSLEEMEG